MQPLKPGATIGILGGGQLGRMLALAAARLGFDCHVYCPEPDSPAFRVAARHTVGAYDDAEALATFANSVDVVTYEFENVPAAAAEVIAARRPLYPDARALATTQDRVAEKIFLSFGAGVEVAPFAAIETEADIETAIGVTGLPAILKTRRLGYDGKGQAKVGTLDELREALERFGGDCVLEGLISFETELSAIVVRGADGIADVYDIGENRHENHILSETIVPAPLAAETIAAARTLGLAIAEKLGYVGTLGVEMFLVREAGEERLLVNELAPRVHNSGHWTEDAAVTSQFENHIRAIAGWPLGAVTRTAPVRMLNLIGDAAADPLAILADPAARLHLYGKREIRAGRKMGHVNYLER